MDRPTIADLAKMAGVSISTVDRVLNARKPVRRATAERVLQAAEQIGFYATGVIKQRLGAGPYNANAWVSVTAEITHFLP